MKDGYRSLRVWLLAGTIFAFAFLVIGCSSPPNSALEEDESMDADEHMDEDEHMDMDEDEHMEDMEGMEGMEHAHAAAEVDPDAPVFDVVGVEFGFDPDPIEVDSETFTIHLTNNGVLEHDITIEGYEDQGGIHLQPGEDGLGSFTLEPGEYTVYCTISGHLDGGMVGSLIVAP